MQYNLSLWYLIIFLSLYSVVMTVLALRNIPSFKLIAIEQTGTRYITDEKDKVLESEQQEFVKRFVRLYTNYDSENFTQTIGHSTDWLSDQAWRKIEEDFKKMKSQILEVKMVQISDIKKIEQSDSFKNEFTLEVLARQIYRGTQKQLKGTLNIKLKIKERTELNPWGWEVDELNESWKEIL